MRLLPTNQVHETSAQELLSDRVPESFSEAIPRRSSKVHEMMENSLGKVLYIEQAHRLTGSTNDQVGTLVRDVRIELIETVKNPRFFGRMIVILAGYETPMDRLLTEQPAFAKRFRVQMQFHPLTNDVCYDVLEKQLKAEDVDLAVTAQEQQGIKEAFQALSESKKWASVNDIQEITNQLIGDAFGKHLSEDSQPSITAFEILQVLRTQYPQLSRGAENLRRLHEGRQRLGQVISERKAQEAGVIETNHVEVGLTVSGSRDVSSIFVPIWEVLSLRVSPTVKNNSAWYIPYQTLLTPRTESLYLKTQYSYRVHSRARTFRTPSSTQNCSRAATYECCTSSRPTSMAILFNATLKRFVSIPTSTSNMTLQLSPMSADLKTGPR